MGIGLIMERWDCISFKKEEDEKLLLTQSEVTSNSTYLVSIDLNQKRKKKKTQNFKSWFCERFCPKINILHFTFSTNSKKKKN